MDPQISDQRRWSIMLVVFIALTLGIFSGIIIAAGMDWIPHSVAQAVVNSDSDKPVEVEPSRILSDTQASFREIVSTVRPAVVSIQAEGVQTGQSMQMPFDMQDPFEFFFGPQGPGQRNQMPRQQPVPQMQISAGSGFIVDPEGYILTNNHVISGATDVKVILDDGQNYRARIVGVDPETDVAVLKIEGNNPFPFIELSDSDNLQVGDWVMAIGNPFGNLAGSVTVGIVSAVHRESLMLPGETYYQDFIQTDAAINFGNSGGPLVDIYGHAVGINTAITSQGSGIGFAIPSSLAKFVYESLRDSGQVVRGWIGVTIQNLDSETAEAFGLRNTNGALIAEVKEGDPAAEGGLQPEDIILQVNNRVVTSTQTASRLIAALPVDQPADFLIWRDGREMHLTITPVRRNDGVISGTGNQQTTPDNEQPVKPRKGVDYLGLSIEELDQRTINEYGLPDGTQGVLITGVDPTGIAYEKGLREDMIIIAVNRQDVTSIDDYDRLMEEAHARWLDDGSSVLLRFMTYSQATGWVRQYAAMGFEE